eukprot:6492799-Amphidinium_carterae.6
MQASSLPGAESEEEMLDELLQHILEAASASRSATEAPASSSSSSDSSTSDSSSSQDECEVGADGNKAYETQPARSRTVRPETFQWGPFRFTFREPSTYQATCPFHESASSTTKCTKSASFVADQEGSRDKVLKQLKLWCLRASLAESKTDHQGSRRLPPLSPEEELLTSADLEAQLALLRLADSRSQEWWLLPGPRDSRWYEHEDYKVTLEVLKFVSTYKPDAVVFENVAGMLQYGHEDKSAYDFVKEKFAAAGFVAEKVDCDLFRFHACTRKRT